MSNSTSSTTFNQPQPPTEANSNNPLSEATLGSLDELFSRDPLHLNDTDIESIVTELRRQRAHWKTIEATGGKKRGAAAPANLSLADLGI